MKRTTWLVTPTVTVAGTDYIGYTPPEALNSMGALLVRIAGALHRSGDREGLLLLDEQAAATVGLTEPATDDGTRQRALDAASGAGFQSTKIGPFTSFYARDRPTIHVGRAELLTGTAAATDPESWPWDHVWHPEITTGLQHWHRLTGVAWQAGPAVMGLELMHRNLTPYRVAGVQGQRRPDLRDESTPYDASEAMWSREMWSRAELAPFAHGYDKRRAGLTAAGAAKLSPCRLVRRRGGQFDPKRAGWWLVTREGWNLGHQLPHPMGPKATDKHVKSLWVTTATMDLCAELAADGLMSMPEVIDSLTGPARQVLGPWQQKLEAVYCYPAPMPDGPDAEDYTAKVRAQVQSAVRVVGKRSIGMLNKADGNSTIWRPDWFHAINATKRANAFRRLRAIGSGPNPRYAVAVEDDCLWIPSDDPDPLQSAPKALHDPERARSDARAPHLNHDTAGNYRIQGTVEHAK